MTLLVKIRQEDKGYRLSIHRVNAPNGNDVVRVKRARPEFPIGVFPFHRSSDFRAFSCFSWRSPRPCGRAPDSHKKRKNTKTITRDRSGRSIFASIRVIRGQFRVFLATIYDHLGIDGARVTLADISRAAARPYETPRALK